MTESELQQYLYKHIPQSASMEVKVEKIEKDSIKLSAPLAPNINHRDSVFGGSASSVAILTAWSFLHLKIRSEDISSTLVIQKNTMSYDSPIVGTFFAEATLSNADDWPRFIKMLKKKGKARIKVSTLLEYNGVVAGSLEGDFVAVMKNG